MIGKRMYAHDYTRPGFYLCFPRSRTPGAGSR